MLTPTGYWLPATSANLLATAGSKMSSKRRAATSAKPSQSLEEMEGPVSKRRKTQVCLLEILFHAVGVRCGCCVVVLEKGRVVRRIHGHGHRLSLGPQGFGPVNSTTASRAICLSMQPPFQVPKLPIATHTMADTEFSSSLTMGKRPRGLPSLVFNSWIKLKVPATKG